jgi:hypothetical protein
MAWLYFLDFSRQLLSYSVLFSFIIRARKVALRKCGRRACRHKPHSADGPEAGNKPDRTIRRRRMPAKQASMESRGQASRWMSLAWVYES